MRTLLQLLIDIFAYFHSYFVEITQLWGLNFTDKQLHFIVIGIVFLFLYIFTDILFRALSKISISIITFIFSFTLSIVISFAIEIGQYQSGTGNMELADIAWGIYGFFVFITIFEIIRALYRFTRYLIMNLVEQKKSKMD